MPTGYTAPLYEGKDISFSEFAVSCARAFGALIEMRDEPLDAAIPNEFVPTSYHQKRLEEAQKEFAEVLQWDTHEAEEQAEKAYQEARDQYLDALKRTEECRQRYRAMLLQVLEWQPPTPDHEDLKKFMVQQLSHGISIDCTLRREPPRYESGGEYKTALLASIQRSIDHHSEQNEKEIALAMERTEWVRALRRSLPEEVPSKIE